MNLFFAILVFSIFLNLAYSVELIPDIEVVKYNISKEFVLQCNLKNNDAHINYTISWSKEGVNVNELDSMKGRIVFTGNDRNATMTISQATDEDAGNYTCSTPDGHSANVFAASTILVNTPENVNVVEGEKLRIVCTAHGRPAPQILWTVAGLNYTNSSGSITLQTDPEKNVPNAVLLIDNVNMTDRGSYKCIGYSSITNEIVEDVSMVRVKDKYAALWPFLGICLEVFVLCAIILIYEKKRNKSELEESDTDQSPEQKNTPDHGKETNLRQRQ